MVTSRTERYQTGPSSEHRYGSQLTIDEVRARLMRGESLSLFVTGWKEPWRCFLDETSQIRAVCPTSSGIMPRVLRKEWSVC